MRKYKVGIGYEGCVFQSYTTTAKNRTEAYYEAVKKLNPNTGYNYIRITPVNPKAGASAPDRNRQRGCKPSQVSGLEVEA